MHFHTLNSFSCTVITIVLMICVNISWYLCILAGCRLLRIVECLKHASVWTSFGQYKVVLIYATLSLASPLVTVCLNILHESGLSIIHHILR